MIYVEFVIAKSNNIERCADCNIMFFQGNNAALVVNLKETGRIVCGPCGEAVVHG